MRSRPGQWEGGASEGTLLQRKTFFPAGPEPEYELWAYWLPCKSEACLGMGSTQKQRAGMG